MDDQKNLIFGNGIDFVDGVIVKNNQGRTKYVTHEQVEEALGALVPQVKAVKEQVAELQEEYKMPSIVINVEIKPRYLSKTNKISELYEKSFFERIGSLPITKKEGNNLDVQERTRIEYMRGDPKTLESVMQGMADESHTTKKLQSEVTRVSSIGLATIDDKLKLIPKNWESGLVYLVLHAMDDEKLLIAKVQHLLNNQDFSQWKFFHANDGLLYISMKLSREEINKLAPFNPLRQVMPKKSYGSVQTEGDFSKERSFYADSDYDSSTLGEMTVGEIDGGIFKDRNPYLSEIKEVGKVTELPSNYFLEHGTSVSSILMYGDLNNVVPGKKMGAESRVKSIRILPTRDITEENKSEDFDFVEAAALLKKVVPEHKEVKVWNISVGPFGPALIDNLAGPLTVALDQLAFKYKMLFCIAVGNTGEFQGEWARIQTPADMINGLAIGSYNLNSKDLPVLSNYTSRGPGREGGVIKPDFLAHGGDEEDLLLTFSTSNFMLNDVFGTSFASPLIARSAIRLINANPELNALDAKALLIHNSTLHFGDISVDRGGHGNVVDVTDVLFSSDDEYRILYSSEMSTGSYAKLSIPMPDLHELKSKSFEFSWTACVMSAVSPAQVDEYAQYTAEVNFYADETKFIYRKKGKSKIRYENDEDVERLLKDGWSRSSFPAPQNFKFKQLTEQSLRDKMKWDTVKSDRVNKKCKSINHPYLVLHALSRNNEHVRIPYSVVLTVRAKEDVNLYQLVKEKYPILAPLKNIIQNRV